MHSLSRRPPGSGSGWQQICLSVSLLVRLEIGCGSSESGFKLFAEESHAETHPLKPHPKSIFIQSVSKIFFRLSMTPVLVVLVVTLSMSLPTKRGLWTSILFVSVWFRMQLSCAIRLSLLEERSWRADNDVLLDSKKF